MVRTARFRDGAHASHGAMNSQTRKNVDMSDDCLIISLPEFIASGCLSNCTFIDHDHDCDPADVNVSRCANAAKLSLLLAQTLMRFDDQSSEIDFTSLKLDNLFVMITSGVGHGAEGDKADGEAKLGEYYDATPLDFNVDPFEEIDRPLDLLSDLSDLNERTSSIQKFGVIIERAQRRLLFDREKFEGSNVPGRLENAWTILEMAIQVSETNSSATNAIVKSQSTYLLKIQHLGRMMYEVFSPGEHQALQETSLLGKYGAEKPCNNEFDVVERHSKLRRYRENSIFSYLLELGHCPYSVCRLLSDMIGPGVDGTADCPFTTIEDVIEDLAQMSSHPQLYICDPEDCFISSKLLFGLGVFGRTKEVASIIRVASSLEAGSRRENTPSSNCVNAVLVSGIAGSGKTFLIRKVASYLISCKQGWIVVGSKFDCNLEHESQDVVYAAFDRLLGDIVGMRDGDIDEDTKYSRSATEAILDGLDREDLSTLALQLPNLRRLVNSIGKVVRDESALDIGTSHWRLIFLLSTLLGAVLSADRPIMMYYDDLQWSDTTTLSLIFEVIISMGKLPHARNRFLFVAMHRDNDGHPFATQYYNVLELSKHVKITSIKLPSMSKNDVTEMLMAELRLPKRAVIHMSGIIHKKTSGHALFIVQLLNSLVRDNIVVYSPTKHRYDWDYDKLNDLETCDNVANLIVTNLASLSPQSLQSLRLLSCLGMRTHEFIIQHIDTCPHIEGADNIASSLPKFIDAGIVQSSASMVIFTHDLIREHVYDTIAMDQRRKIHLSIGMFLRSTAAFDFQNHDSSIRASNVPCKEVTKDRNQTVALIATDHINLASEQVVDCSERIRYAGYNLWAATEASKDSNFQSALHYCKSGISFLNVWTHEEQDSKQDLCYSLYKGAAFSLLALGKADHVAQYANVIIKNVTFERSLEAQYLLIRSLECIGSNTETIATGLAVLRKLGISLPFSPKLYLSYVMGGIRGTVPSIVVQSMRKTDKIASQDRKSVV